MKARTPSREPSSPTGPRSSTELKARTLRPSQTRVLRLVAEGMTAQEVADELWLSHFTVRAHLKAIHAELGARNSAHAVAIAIRHQLI